MSSWNKSSLVGRVFGKLTVLSLAEKDSNNFRATRSWVCQCECGKTTVVPTGKLNNGNTKSCGCLRELFIHPNLIGQTFGKLTVVCSAGKRKERSLWECACECGKVAFVRTSHLRSGQTKSCGCLCSGGKRDFEKNESIRNLVFFTYRDNAKSRGRDFALTVEEADSIFQSNCFYCNAEPSRTRTRANRKGEYTYNGIDRLDNSVGYVAGNVVPCCTRCNLTKGSMDYNEFIQWIKDVYLNRIPQIV